jgi:hypothetical protein
MAAVTRRWICVALLFAAPCSHAEQQGPPSPAASASGEPASAVRIYMERKFNRSGVSQFTQRIGAVGPIADAFRSRLRSLTPKEKLQFVEAVPQLQDPVPSAVRVSTSLFEYQSDYEVCGWDVTIRRSLLVRDAPVSACSREALHALQNELNIVIGDLAGEVLMELPRSSVDGPQIGRW